MKIRQLHHLKPAANRDPRDGTSREPVRVAGREGYLRDRSAGGLGLWLPAPAAVGDVLMVRFDPAGGPAGLTRAEVCHCRPEGNGWALGCRLVAAV